MNVDVEILKDDKGVRPEKVAVIAAAISIALSRRVQVKRVRYMHALSDNIWAQQGRINIMNSRRTKR